MYQRVVMLKAKISILLSALLISGCNFSAPKKSVERNISLSQIQKIWQLTHIDGIQLAQIVESTLIIDDDFQAKGRLGCNSFLGELELRNTQLRMKYVPTTHRQCGELKNTVEMDVRRILSEWADVSITKNVLVLSNLNHTLTYQFIE